MKSGEEQTLFSSSSSVDAWECDEVFIVAGVKCEMKTTAGVRVWITYRVLRETSVLQLHLKRISTVLAGL